eukprot:362833-Chlamydomonas_euryale.AAC.3
MKFPPTPPPASKASGCETSGAVVASAPRAARSRCRGMSCGCPRRAFAQPAGLPTLKRDPLCACVMDKQGKMEKEQRDELIAKGAALKEKSAALEEKVRRCAAHAKHHASHAALRLPWLRRSKHSRSQCAVASTEASACRMTSGGATAPPQRCCCMRACRCLGSRPGTMAPAIACTAFLVRSRHATPRRPCWLACPVSDPGTCDDVPCRSTELALMPRCPTRLDAMLVGCDAGWMLVGSNGWMRCCATAISSFWLASRHLTSPSRCVSHRAAVSAGVPTSTGGPARAQPQPPRRTGGRRGECHATQGGWQAARLWVPAKGPRGCRRGARPH